MKFTTAVRIGRFKFHSDTGKMAAFFFRFSRSTFSLSTFYSELHVIIDSSVSLNIILFYKAMDCP